MAKCDYCGSTIVFGGKKDANGRFCNQRCQARGTLLAISRQIADATVQEQVWKAQQGPCPKCQGPGPIDVHVIHKVWSAVLLTQWSSTPQMCCRSCGVKGQMGGAAFSLILGWWGIPWGILLTPIQIGRNIYGLARQQDPTKPSAQFEKAVRMNIAANALRQQKAKAAVAAPQIP